MKVFLIFFDIANLTMEIRSIHWWGIRKWSNKTTANISQVLLVHESDFPIITLSSPRRRVLCEKRGGYCKVLSQPVMREFEFMAPPTAQEKYFQDIGFQASHSPPAKNNTHTQFSMIVRRSPPRRSPPQTFTTPSVKSDVHHPRRSPPLV